MRKRIIKDVNIFWFRRDLRLKGNLGLFQALKARENVLPVFIFDPVIFNSRHQPHRQETFVYNVLIQLKDELEKIGSSLYILQGKPFDVFKNLNKEFRIRSVYTNRGYEPYSVQRDAEVFDYIASSGATFHSFKDHVIFDQDELMQPDGTACTDFKSYSELWKKKLNRIVLEPCPTEKYFYNFIRIKPFPVPSLQQLGFTPTGNNFPSKEISVRQLEEYASNHNFPALDDTTGIGVHLRFGTVGIRQLTALAEANSEAFLERLIWRNFYMDVLYHFPQLVDEAFHQQFDDIEWENNKEHFKLWCEGKTGFPLVDAGMRELNTTGLMHHRSRMVAASFLSKHLLIDWRWGEDYFASKLLDYELASSIGEWQRIVGIGCEAMPYFQILSPELQAKKYDPDLTYIKQWVPEYGTDEYLAPIVDKEMAKERTIEAYRRALTKVV